MSGNDSECLGSGHTFFIMITVLQTSSCIMIALPLDHRHWGQLFSSVWVWLLTSRPLMTCMFAYRYTVWYWTIAGYYISGLSLTTWLGIHNVMAASPQRHCTHIWREHYSTHIGLIEGKGRCYSILSQYRGITIYEKHVSTRMYNRCCT